MIRRDFLAKFQKHFAINILRHWRDAWRSADGLFANDFHIATARLDDHRIVHKKLLRHLPFRIVDAQRARIRQFTRKCRGDSRFGADEIALIVFRSRTVQEVAVVRPHADSTVGGAEALPDARPAGGFQNAATCRKHIRQTTFQTQHRQNLTASRRDAKLHIRMNGAATQHRRHHAQIFQRTVCAGTDHDLRNRQSRHFRYRFYIARIGRASRHRNEFAKIDVDNTIINRVIIGLQLFPAVCTAFCLQEGQRRFVRREDG